MNALREQTVRSVEAELINIDATVDTLVNRYMASGPNVVGKRAITNDELFLMVDRLDFLTENLVILASANSPHSDGNDHGVLSKLANAMDKCSRGIVASQSFRKTMQLRREFQVENEMTNEEFERVYSKHEEIENRITLSGIICTYVGIKRYIAEDVLIMNVILGRQSTSQVPRFYH